ncbi:RDD family protein [Nocardiopsis algeriensis]|uniref:Putative RDD family membrane protein YckC n=1 Tax=Nocardiopsis algeriensis TaxID=1478215 RepID=A0A841IMH7_9ACTN|nr:RDD family protein [Nocardiopsis algeriensis]MBB6119272.1 putative RDD family membrane protein YckC [Nocardiopsis algeriensis]
MSDTSGAATAADDDFRYRGNRLGLPESGPGSVPGVFRRVAGLVLDWFLALALAWAAHGLGLVGSGVTEEQEVVSLISNTALVIFAVMNILLLTLFGTSVGRRLVGVGITATGERSWPWFVSMAVRTLLLCLFVPAVIYDRDTRGLHDRAAGTVVTRY